MNYGTKFLYTKKIKNRKMPRIELATTCITHLNRVNKNKNSTFGAARVGERTKDCALRKFFPHHYTTR
jgi:hypothetical protein